MESNPYLDARREWDERYADLVLGKRNWQITAAGMMVITLALAVQSSGLHQHAEQVRSLRRRSAARTQAGGVALSQSLQ